MGAFKPAVITKKGRELVLTALTEGAKFEFSKIAISSSYYNQLTLDSLETLSNINAEEKASVIKQDESTLRVSATFTNENLTKGYEVRTVGLYVMNSNGEEFLYSVSVADGLADYIPPYNGVGLSTMIIDLVTTLSDTSIVTLTVDSSSYVTMETIEPIIASQKELELKVEDKASKDMVNAVVNTQRCNISSVEFLDTPCSFVVSTEENRITFSDKTYGTEISKTCIIGLSDYKNRMVRVVGTLSFDTLYSYEDEFVFRISGGEVANDYRYTFGDSCTVDIDVSLYMKDSLILDMISHEQSGYEKPKVSGTLQILPYIPENNSTTYVQDETKAPSNPMKNDLWVWDGSIKRYDGSKWVELLPIDDSVPLKISCSGSFEIPEYMYHVEHEDNTYIVKINYKFEEAFYNSSGAYLDIFLDNLDVTKPLYLKVDIEKYGATNASIGYIYGEDYDYNEILCDSSDSESLKSGTLTISPNPLLVGGYIRVGYGDFYDDTVYYYPDFRGTIKIWQD